MAGIAAQIAFGFTLALSACGGQSSAHHTHDRQPLAVVASPAGFTFEGQASIQLLASRPSNIFFTLNGADPAGSTAHSYTRPIVLEQSTLIMFIAVGNDGVWSEPVQEAYRPAPRDRAPPGILVRALQVDRSDFFFTPRADESATETTFRVRSTGLDTVHIRNIEIGPGARGGGFYEPGIFALKSGQRSLDLGSGQTVDLVVSYKSTSTLRSAVLAIESDELTHTDGRIFIELWGRVFAGR